MCVMPIGMENDSDYDYDSLSLPAFVDGRSMCSFGVCVITPLRQYNTAM